MGWWSSVKNAVKGAVRVISKGFVDLVNRLSIGLPDLIFGFLNWPPKKLRVKVLILSIETSPVPVGDDVFAVSGPVVTIAEVKPSIDFAKRVLKERFNIKLVNWAGDMIEILPGIAPDSALNVDCGSGALGNELGEAGDFFDSNRVGEFGITIFIVNNVSGKLGCSLGPFANYVTVDVDGIRHSKKSTLVHELGHACGLWHQKKKNNLMYDNTERGENVKWWQKNLVRSCRHVTYW